MGPSGFFAFAHGSHPEGSLERGSHRALLFAPLLVLSIVNFAIAMLMRPAFLHAFAGQPAGVAAFFKFMLWLTALFFPVLVLVKALVLAATGWSIAALADEWPRVRTLVSLVLFGEVLLLLRPIFDVVVLYLRGLHTLRQPGDLRVRWGLDFFLDPQSPVLAVLVQHASVFHLMWGAFLYIALPRVTALSRSMAFVITAALWIAILALDVIWAIMRS